MPNNQEQKTIDLSKIVRTLWAKKKAFYKVWAWTFVLSCIWILPQPRYYACEVKLAPEMNGESVGGGLSSIAASFGFNLGAMGGADAIYPELYPDLFENPEFIVGLYNIQITTKDKAVTTTYYEYMKDHQKKNYLTLPFRFVMKSIKDIFEEEDTLSGRTAKGEINPFWMSKRDYDLMQVIMDKISCSVDKKNNVISIKVADQDPLVCAMMADSVKNHLQSFIIRYRTSKASEDVLHYQQARDSVEYEYDKAREAFSRFSDMHRDIVLQSYQSEKDKLESNLSIKQNSLTAMETQLQAAKVKLQEKIPAFTTLKCAIVPIKPAGPKRMLFVLGMLILASAIKGYLLVKDQIL